MSEEEIQNQIKNLIHKRGLIKAGLTRFCTYVNNFIESENIYELQSRLEKINISWNEFEHIQSELDILDTNIDHTPERVKFEDQFFAYTGKAKLIIDKHLTNTAQNKLSLPQQNTSASNPINEISNLPKLNLPEFCGSYDKWLQFSNTYQSIIHNNVTLNKIQKFWYLKSCLKGEAANVLNSLEVSEVNYDKAWDLLRERFENKKVIIQTHLKSIFDIPSIAKESAYQLRNLIDNLSQHLRSLESLGLPVNSWNTIIIFLISSKLDHVTKREWEEYSLKINSDTPSIADFKSFLNKRCQLLENLQPVKSVGHRSFSQKSTSQHSSATHLSVNQPICISCKKDHLIFSCQEFLKLTPQARLNKIRSLRACTNCLRQGHSSKECRNQHSCKKCSERHNTLLHLVKIQRSDQDIQNNQGTSNIASELPNLEITQNTNESNLSQPSHSLSITNQATAEPYILLSTAIISVLDKYKQPHSCRVLLDNCSQSNFITKNMFSKLGLSSTKISHSVEGFGSGLTTIFEKTRLTVKSQINSFSLTSTFLVTDRISGNIPMFLFDSTHLNMPQNIILADNTFNQPGPIDMLLGASVFWNLICIGQIVLPNTGTILQKTKLGWILSGPLLLNSSNNSVCNVSINSSQNQNIHKLLERFWQIEEYSTQPKLSQEEVDCEKHFANTTTRDEHGRLVVSLPVKENLVELGDSYDTALRRFYSIENKLSKNHEMKRQYMAFMAEYENLGHMSKIHKEKIDTENITYYLPHHCVFKESSTTTKLRVVFDGSAKTSSGLSLNNTLKVGPKLQDDLMDIVIRFRTYKVAFIADIEKMYRCVMVNERDRDLQRILFRFNPLDELSHYQLNTVTYGTASASFLAIRALQQIAMDKKCTHPHVSEVILSSFYVDDLLSGADSIENATELITDITQILQAYGFHLRKFVTSTDSILNNISIDKSESSHKVISDDKIVKTLGLTWNSSQDTFQYIFNIIPSSRVTKRTILSTIAQIFDPLGLVGPFVIKAKLILQQLWQLDVNWDESVPMELHRLWTQFSDQIPLINDIHVPRHVLCSSPVTVELHGFSDASEKAYGCCCYLRSIDSSRNVMVHLLCAKSRVAPLKRISLPRLELCGALLLVRLTHRIVAALKIQINNIHYYSDSTIVLAWIALQPNQLHTFVANRVSEIQQFSTVNQWSHVFSENNPADIISRGLYPQDLKSSRLWWNGPTFLMQENIHIPQKINSNIAIPELKNNSLIMTIQRSNDIPIINRFSSFTRLVRVTSYCIRFIKNLKVKSISTRVVGALSKNELSNAVTVLCNLVQSNYFYEEYQILKQSKPLHRNSPILKLNPFLDENDLIRVGGRLKYSNFTFNQKHPILIPSSGNFTKLVILYEHLRHLHAGAQMTLSAVRMTFWPINGRNVTQKILRSCITCFKAQPLNTYCQMGDLPRKRITPQRPFQTTGIDFAGPFLIKDGKAKSKRLIKCYLCVYVCFTTKAAHLELVGDLSTQSFLNSFKRFISRRGICSDVYTDNGTNFVGAEREIRNIFAQIIKESKFTEFLSINNIRWHFSPPYGPNFGGLWEACVKSTKYHLKRILGNAHLTYECLNTVFIQIEAVLNSRPLVPISNDPNDLSALTPAHFLIGEPLTALPQTDVRDVAPNRLSLYHQLQQRVQHFWQRWSRQYLCTLQERSKWKEQSSNLKIGAMVVLKDENSAPLTWKMGRITDVFPGGDDVVRVVNVKTSSGIVKRPATKLCLLPVQAD